MAVKLGFGHEEEYDEVEEEGKRKRMKTKWDTIDRSYCMTVEDVDVDVDVDTKEIKDGGTQCVVGRHKLVENEKERLDNFVTFYETREQCSVDHKSKMKR